MTRRYRLPEQLLDEIWLAHYKGFLRIFQITKKSLKAEVPEETKFIRLLELKDRIEEKYRTVGVTIFDNRRFKIPYLLRFYGLKDKRQQRRIKPLVEKITSDKS